MPNCNHEKTDTRIVVHILHALNQNMKSVMVHTVNTDIILNLVGALCNTAFSGLVVPSTGTDCVISTQFVIPSVQKQELFQCFMHLLAAI